MIVIILVPSCPRYREERIRELESRLARRCGESVPDAGSTTENVPQTEPPGDNANHTLGNAGDGDDIEAGAGYHHTSVDIDADNHSHSSKLETLSRQRREIDAAIAAALEASYAKEETLSGDRTDVDHEPPDSARRRRREVVPEDKPHKGERRRQQRQFLGSDGSRIAEELFTDGRDGTPVHLPIGKPPLAPSRSGGRPSHHSCVRGRSSVSEVEDAQGGSVAGKEAKGSGGRNSSSSSVADEVQTEATGIDSDGSVGGGISDVEGSVWEESFPLGDWDGNDERNALEGVPPESTEVGDEIVWDPANHNGPRHRQNYRVRSGTHENEHIGRVNRTMGDEGVSKRAARILATGGLEESLHSGSGRVSKGKQRPPVGSGGHRTSPAIHDLDISSPEATMGTCSGSRTREVNRNSKRRGERDTTGGGQKNVLPGVPDSSTGARGEEARRRRRRRQDDRSVRVVDDCYWEDTEETKRHRNGSLESPVASRCVGGDVVGDLLDTGGVRDESHVIGDEVDDDDNASYESRWSLSAEEEPPEENVPENDAYARRSYGGGEDVRELGLEERAVSPDRNGQEHSQGGKSSIVSEIAEGVANHEVGVVPQYIDDFAEAPETKSQDNDGSFDGVASPR